MNESVKLNLLRLEGGWTAFMRCGATQLWQHPGAQHGLLTAFKSRCLCAAKTWVCGALMKIKAFDKYVCAPEVHQYGVAGALRQLVGAELFQSLGGLGGCEPILGHLRRQYAPHAQYDHTP